MSSLIPIHNKNIRKEVKALNNQDQNRHQNKNTKKSNNAKVRHHATLPENNAEEMEIGEIGKPAQKGKSHSGPLPGKQTGIDKGRWSD